MEAFFGIMEQEGFDCCEVPIVDYYRIGKILQEKTDGQIFEYMEDVDIEEIQRVEESTYTLNDEFDEFYGNKNLQKPLKYILEHSKGPHITDGGNPEDGNRRLCIYKPKSRIPEEHREYAEDIKKAIEEELSLV